MADIIFGGYRGIAWVAGSAVLITSGDLNVTENRVYNTYREMPQSESVTQVLVNKGTYDYGGSVGFDLITSDVSLIDTFLTRATSFDVVIFDGSDSSNSLSDCYMTSFSVSGSVGGTVAGSLSFITNQEWSDGGSTSPPYKRDNSLIPYWKCGNDSVIDWSLSANQIVNPVHNNSTSNGLASYFRVTTMEAVLTVTTNVEQFLHTEITINGSTVYSVLGITTGAGYSFGSQTEPGKYTHTFTSAGTAYDSAIVT